MLKTITKLGPKDHGRLLDYDDYLAADFQLGYDYELINGSLYVSPRPNLPHDFLEQWLHGHLSDYCTSFPSIINYVTTGARIVLPEGKGVTAPEPDIAAYHDFPLDLPVAEMRWETITPVLAVEIVSEDDPAKDLMRNVALYLKIPSIREYWIVDGRADWDHPTLLVYRRRGRRWQDVLTLEYGGTYTTRLLPDFSLTIDPRS